MNEPQNEMSAKDRANEAFQIVIKAVNLAMIGEFPLGIDHCELHLRIKGALQYVGQELKNIYGDMLDEEPTIETPPPALVASDAAIEMDPAEPNTPEPAIN